MPSRTTAALTACLTLGLVHSLSADARIEERTKFQLAGVLGRVVNLFGGKSARDGVTSTISVRGDRKVRLTSNDGQIIDLAEEKIYDLDLKKKTYTVVTFAELRRQMEEARKKAQAEAAQDKGKTQAEPAKPDESAKELEVDFTVKNTGEKKTVNGFDATQSIVTVTVREKGKTLEQGGGVVLTNDVWLTPSLPALKEVQDFDVRYAKKMADLYLSGASPQETASVMAMYPMMKPAFERMAAEASKMQGVAVQTITTLDAVKSADQLAAEQRDSPGAAKEESAPPTSVGGLIGGFGRRMAQRKNNDDAANKPRDRATVMTTTFDLLKASTSVTPDDLSIPAGFKEERR